MKIHQESDSMIAQLKNIDNQLNAVDNIIKNYSNQYIKMAFEKQSAQQSSLNPQDKSASRNVYIDALEEYNISYMLDTIIPAVTHTPKSFTEEIAVSMKKFTISHQSLITSMQEVSCISWPKPLDHSHPTFKTFYIYLKELYGIFGKTSNSVNLLNHLQIYSDHFNSIQQSLDANDRQKLCDISLYLNETYDRLSDIVINMVARANELSDAMQKFVAKNPVQIMYDAKLQKTKTETDKRFSDLDKRKSLPIEDIMSLTRKALAENMRLFNAVMKDASPDINKLADAERLYKSLESLSPVVGQSLDALIGCKHLPSFSASDQITRRLVKDGIKELKEIQLRYKRMLKTVHKQYDKYITSSSSLCNQLQQSESQLAHLKSLLEQLKSNDSSTPPFMDMASLQLMHASICDGSYANSIFGYLKHESSESLEINKPIIQKCNNLLSEIKDLIYSLIQIYSHSSLNSSANQESLVNFPEQASSLINKETDTISNGSIMGQDGENNVLDYLNESSSDSISLSEIKMNLEQMISSFDNHQVNMVMVLTKTSRFNTILMRNDMAYSSLSLPDRDLLMDCVELFRQLMQKIKAQVHKPI